MSVLHRLRLLAAVLGVSTAAIAVGTFVVGDSKTGPAGPSAPALARAEGQKLAEDLAKTKFTSMPALAYTSQSGEHLFAWQVKPTLAITAERPRDILVMVDTSASQAGKPLVLARQIISALAKTTSSDDRIAVWTVNLNNDSDTKALTNGFVAPNAADIQIATSRLADQIYGAGATDLKAGLEKATKSFENRQSRQQVLLYLGDGESNASPGALNEAARVAIGSDLERNNIQFFAVPLGVRLQANTLHGFAALTGGAVVRLNDDLAGQHGQSTFGEKLKAAFNVPVFRADKVTFGADVVETYPAKLPPLRGDRATLVMGKLANPTKELSLNATGLVGNAKVTLNLSEALPASQSENFFLNAMVMQWRTPGAKDSPAILGADRALAMASEQYRLFKEEYLTQAEWAISTGRLDQAEKLFQAAKKIDPSDRDADSGLKVVAKLRDGKVTLDQIKQGVNGQKNATKLGADGNITRVVLKNIADEPAKPAAPQAGGGTGASPAQNDIVRDAQARRAIQEEQFKVLVDDTLRKARQLQQSDPDAAYEDLKRQRESVLANDQIGEKARQSLALQLDAQMRDVQTKGAEVKRRVAEERERIARARAGISSYERNLTQETQTQSRIEQFKQLMTQAKFELAQQEAEVMRQERIAQGKTVPPEVLASYTIGQRATNLREYRELARLRDDRFLLTMMQVGKSFMPYPDEPPVHFPPAAIWRELSANRKVKYAANSLGSDVPQSMRDLQDTLENKRVRFEETISEKSLSDILNNLSKQFNISFIVMEEAFKAEGKEGILEKKPNVNQKLNGLTLRSFLDIVMAGVDATIIVRPEYIEITTVNRRLEEKVTTAFSVADLIIPIPQSVNQQSLYQNLQLQGQQLAIFGAAAGAANFTGGFAGGQFQGGGGGGFGNFGGGGLGGGLGGGGLGGGGLGAGGGGGLGQFGQLGNNNNLGNGGGILGTTGGQLGQFGNLGGQFGLQGGDQSGLLLQLIINTVARGEWDRPSASQLQQNPGQQNQDGDPIELVKKSQLNSLGYYPPARALVVRATGLYHSQSSYKLKLPDGGAAGGPGNPARGAFVIGPNTPAPAAGGNNQPKIVNPKEDPVALAAKIENNAPEQKWQQALDMSNVTDPGLIVACAEFLMQGNAKGKSAVHAAELLKANLRKGVVNEAWTHAALAIALKEAKADSAEILRAEMSAIDLEPSNAKSFIQAANTAAEQKQFDTALAFYKKAADLEPNTAAAYTNALAMATRTDEIKSDTIAWAASNIFSRDWTNDGLDIHAEAKTSLNLLSKKFENTLNKGEMDKLMALAANTKRDLTIELRYQGAGVDVDMVVTEPTKGVASALSKRTSGGGVLIADVIEQGEDRSEIYTVAQAFSGTYNVQVKPVLGRAIGNKATLVVTKFAGTDKKFVETFSVDLSKPSNIEVTLNGGSRTELASVPTDDNSYRTMTTGTAPAARGPSGISGGVGSASDSLLNGQAGGSSASAMPSVVKPVESKVAGMSAASPGLRVEQSLTPDRQSTKVSVNPVFSNTAVDLPMPKVSLLPGGE